MWANRLLGMLEELPQLTHNGAKGRALWPCAQMAAYPFGQLLHLRHVLEACIAQQDGAIVVAMPDDTADCLIDGACRIQTVPFLAAEQLVLFGAIRFQVATLQYHLGILERWKGQARYDHRPTVAIGKVQALGHLAATHGHKAGALRVAYRLIELLHGARELILAARLQKYWLAARYIRPQAARLPSVHALVQHRIRRKEHQQTVRHNARHIQDRLAQRADVLRIVPVYGSTRNINSTFKYTRRKCNKLRNNKE